MSTPRSEESEEFFSGSESGDLEWMRLLAAAGRLYDELAKAGIVDRATRPGQPKRGGLLPGWALSWRERERRTLLEIGAMIEVLTDRRRGTKRRSAIPEEGLAHSEEVIAKLKEAERSDLVRQSLKKLARHYIKAGQKCQQESGEDWPPPPLDGRRRVPPQELRKHFQQMIILAAARWAANKARPSCHTRSPNYAALVKIRNRRSIMGRACAFFLQPD